MKALKIGAGIVIILVLGNFILTHVVYRVFPELIGVGFAFLPSPAKPVIKYGEFPFRLVYELNGDQIVIEDTIICEYDGIGIDAGQGKFRKWKSHFLSSGDEVTYLGLELSRDDEKIFYMEVGDENYYMGDWEETRYEDQETKDFENTIRMIPVEEWTVAGWICEILSEEELSEKYNINIIEWTHAPPIENKFK